MSHLHVAADKAGVGAAAAAHVHAEARGAISARGIFTVAFSGGSLPEIIAPALISYVSSCSLSSAPAYCSPYTASVVVLTGANGTCSLLMSESFRKITRIQITSLFTRSSSQRLVAKHYPFYALN